MLIFTTYLWGDKYGATDVMKLRNSIRRNTKEDHQFVLITDRMIEMHGVRVLQIPSEDIALTRMPGCFARLRLFDLEWQRRNLFPNPVQPGDRIVNIDLDTVIVGNVDSCFHDNADFKILQGANAANPCPYVGAIFQLRPGSCTRVWGEFKFNPNLPEMPVYEFPDDQGWLSIKAPGAVEWQAGKASGIYAFQKPGWPAGTTVLPDGAKIVTFIGWRKPGAFTGLPWVMGNWRR